MSGNNATTAWERTLRRREVIRLRLGDRMSVSEIAEETGFTEQTIRRDFKWIESQLEKLRDPETIEKFLLEGAMHLMDHEVDDLERMDRENDMKGKHNAKQSMRSTLKMVKEFTGDIEGDGGEEGDAERYIEELPEEVREGLVDHAAEEIEVELGQ